MTDAQQDIQLAVEHLIRTASRHGLVACGFVFGFEKESQMIVNFGNCPDAGELKLYQAIVNLCNAQRAQGKVISVNVKEAN